MTKYNIVMCCYDKILVNVAAYVTTCQDFYHNNTLLRCILSFNDSWL